MTVYSIVVTRQGKPLYTQGIHTSFKSCPSLGKKGCRQPSHRYSLEGCSLMAICQRTYRQRTHRQPTYRQPTYRHPTYRQPTYLSKGLLALWPSVKEQECRQPKYRNGHIWLRGALLAFVGEIFGDSWYMYVLLVQHIRVCNSWSVL